MPSLRMPTNARLLAQWFAIRLKVRCHCKPDSTSCALGNLGKRIIHHMHD